MNLYLAQLTGGRRGSLGDAPEILTHCLQQPKIIDEIWSGLDKDDKVLRSRCAWLIRHICLQQAVLIQPFLTKIIKRMGSEQQWEVREQLCIVVGQLKLSPSQRLRVLALLQQYLLDNSSIVKTCALQGLSDLAQQDNQLKFKVLDILHRIGHEGTPAMRARTRKLLKLNHLR